MATTTMTTNIVQCMLVGCELRTACIIACNNAPGLQLEIKGRNQRSKKCSSSTATGRILYKQSLKTKHKPQEFSPPNMGLVTVLHSLYKL